MNIVQAKTMVNRAPMAVCIILQRESAATWMLNEVKLLGTDCRIAQRDVKIFKFLLKKIESETPETSSLMVNNSASSC